MNWTDIHSRVDERVTIGSCRINRLLFADDLALLTSFQQCIQHALDRFSAACDQANFTADESRWIRSPSSVLFIHEKLGVKQVVLNASVKLTFILYFL